MKKIEQTAIRAHEICAGHRVVGHESKCARIHGHGYVFTFHCQGTLDTLGRVLDFSKIKTFLCDWLENNWDHKFLCWEQDVVMKAVDTVLKQDSQSRSEDGKKASDSIIWVPFNPTAENMATYLLNVIGPEQLAGTGVRLIKVVVEETRKCSASAEL